MSQNIVTINGLSELSWCVDDFEMTGLIQWLDEHAEKMETDDSEIELINSLIPTNETFD